MAFSGDNNSFNAFLNFNKPLSDHCPDTTLRLNFPDASASYGSNGTQNKRKFIDVDWTKNTDDDFSLALSLGHSSRPSVNNKMNSATSGTMSSIKENGEGSSMEICLNSQHCLGDHDGNGSHSLKKPTVFMAKPLEGPVCDLQLSLSSGPSASVITTGGSLFSMQNQNSLEMSVSVNRMSVVDEGSTSSRWKSGVSMLPSLHTNQSVDSFSLNWADTTKNDLVPSVSNLLSTTKNQGPKSPVSHNSGIAYTHQQRSPCTRTCQFQGCGKGARGASGLCIAHGGGRRCQREGCHKGAEGRTLYCKAHGGGRRCQLLGCTKSAEGRTDFCIAHGGGRRCSHEGCTRAARGKSGLCIRHGGGKRCQRENCTRSAEGFSGLCISHGGGRRCQYVGCTKGAQGSTIFCKAHGGGKRCTVLGCTKGAEGSTPFCKGHGGGKRCSFQGGEKCPKSVHGGTQFCVAHGGGKRCAAPECTKSARGRTNFCVRHGGGKRCKSEGCGKSAQGRTDFCKAHGGGKRCVFGQSASTPGPQWSPCGRFARGKSGLCLSHSSIIQDHASHGGVSLLTYDGSHNVHFLKPEKMKETSGVENAFAVVGTRGHNIAASWNASESKSTNQVSSLVISDTIALPEGRVHGGSLMAMLANSTGAP